MTDSYPQGGGYLMGWMGRPYPLVNTHQVGGLATYAEGDQGVAASTAIALERERGKTVRAVASCGASVSFALIGAMLIMFAPAERDTATLVCAFAFLVIAAGLSGFNYVKASHSNITVRNQ